MISGSTGWVMAASPGSTLATYTVRRRLHREKESGGPDGSAANHSVQPLLHFVLGIHDIVLLVAGAAARLSLRPPRLLVQVLGHGLRRAVQARHRGLDRVDIRAVLHLVDLLDGRLHWRLVGVADLGPRF